MADIIDEHAQRTPVAWVNYIFTALDFMAPPKCKKCHHRKRWAGTTIEYAIDQTKDVVTGFKPKFLCMNMVSITPAERKAHPKWPDQIPCSEHFRKRLDRRMNKIVDKKRKPKPEPKVYLDLG